MSDSVDIARHNGYEHSSMYGSPTTGPWDCPCTGRTAHSCQMKTFSPPASLVNGFYPHMSLFQWFSDLEEYHHQQSWSPPESYMKLEVLGQGTFGTVFRCYDRKANREFVSKETNARSATYSEVARNEIDTLKCLNHPNVIEYYGSFVGDKIIIVHLEYLKGGSLLQKMQQSGPILEKDAVNYLWQIVDGLAYIHTQGIVHTDLKCDNILLDDFENAKIADFGSAVKKSTRDGSEFFCSSDAQLGISLYWSSPEIINQEEFNQSTDIWSLGCLIVEMLTSNPPYWHLFETEFLASVEARILTYDSFRLIPNGSAAMKLYLSFLLDENKQKRLANGTEAREKLKQIFSLYLACFYHRLFGFQDEGYQ
uniref:Protein kinase domain-containing protein n=2 Tax=Plectus sambesii TaxID=2011161 RepID=A0A914VFB7_9BILA